jgi:TonB family protein
MSLHLEPRAHQRAGRMTSAMRAAVAPGTAKVLRVAIVVEGRIIEERIFRERKRVSGLVEDRLTLFDVRDGTWFLCVPNGATGHVVTEAGRSDVGPIASRVRLDESSRGKILVGKQAVLFQFVVPPPRPSSPQLPLSTKGRQIDWMLTVIAAFSFLVHFGVIGAMFSDWADPVVASEDNVVKVIDMTQKITQATVVEDRETPASTNPTPSTKTNDSAKREQPSATSSEARTAALVADAEAMQMSLLMAWNGTTAVQNALKRGDIAIGPLNNSERVDSTGSELHLTTHGGTSIPGATLNQLGDTQRHEGTTQERQVDGPKFDMTYTCQLPPGTGDTNIESTIARLRPSFRSCYVHKGLDLDPTMEGKLVIDIKIAPNGDVDDVKKVDGSGLSPAVEQCIIDRAHNASFNPPGGTGTHARVPIIFRQQH